MHPIRKPPTSASHALAGVPARFGAQQIGQTHWLPDGPTDHPWMGSIREGVLMSPQESPDLLTPSEVAAMFRVSPKTVGRWAQAGKLSSMKTLGGHRRYRASEVHELLSNPEGLDVIGHGRSADPKQKTKDD